MEGYLHHLVWGTSAAHNSPKMAAGTGQELKLLSNTDLRYVHGSIP